MFTMAHCLCLKNALTKVVTKFGTHQKNVLFFNRDLNCGSLVYMFSLRFSGSKFLEQLAIHSPE